MEGMREKKHFFLPNQLLNNHKKNPLCVPQNFSFCQCLSKKRENVQFYLNFFFSRSVWSSAARRSEVLI